MILTFTIDISFYTNTIKKISKYNIKKKIK